MLRMRTIVFVFSLLGLTCNLFAQQTQKPNSDATRITARIIDQKYCRGDADVFTASLGLEIEIENLSNKTTELLWPMVPWVGKVAAAIADAQAGRFTYEQTASRYLRGRTHFERITIEARNKVLRKSQYYLVSRRNPAFSLSKSVPAGRYAVVLVLRPVQEPPPQMQGPDILTSMTTEPFIVDIPTNPDLVTCEASTKTN